MQEHTLNLEKKLQVAMRENSLLKINRRRTNQVTCTSIADKGRNVTKQNFKRGNSQNALLSKLRGKFKRHIPKFFDTDVFPYRGSDFRVGKGAFGKYFCLKLVVWK